MVFIFDLILISTLQFWRAESPMSQIQQLISLISNILQSTDSNLRKQSEDTLVTLRTQKPNELMNAFLMILDSQGQVQHRNFAATQIRLCLSNFSSASYTNLWTKLTPECQETIKQKLFEIVYKEEDGSMKKHLSDCLGEIAGSVLSENDKAWPEFKINVWKLFQDSNINSNLAAFNILEAFFSYAPEHFKEDSNNLFVLFKAGLNHDHIKMKIGALKAFSSYLEILQGKKQAGFQQLILPIYEAVYIVLVNDNHNDQGLEVLSDMIEVEPKFFKKKFKELFELMQKIFHIPKLESGVRRMATELLIDYAEKYPALFRKKGDVLKNLIEMIFTHMIEIQSDISDEWKSPPEGYNDDMEDDADFETTRFGMNAVDRLIYSVGQEELLPVLSNTIQQMLQQQDWRYQYTAVMALSQIGQYIDDADKISSIMQMIAGFLKSSNPMMRYAACHAIGQISDDMQPKFQQKYGTDLFPDLVALLQDPVPRVVSHAAASLTNFLEGMKLPQVQSKLDQTMELLLYHSVNGISLVKESALSTISTVAEITMKDFQKYFNMTIELLFGIFQTDKHKSKEYKQLKGQAIETLTIIANSVGPQIFNPAAEKLIHLMISIQTSQFQQNDPQKTYILAGWQRLCLVYGKQLGGYLDKILPSLFALVQNVIKNQLELSINPDVKEEKEPSAEGKKEDENINTFETEEAEVAISMLNVFIEQLKQLYAPYVEKTVHLLCTIIKDHPNDDVKEEACKCLPNLIAAIKTTNEGLAVNLAKYFMETLVTTIEKEFDTDIMIVELETLKNVIDELGLCFLNEPEVSAFSQKMLNLLKSSDDKKMHSKNYITQEEVDEEEKEMIHQEIKQEEEVQVAISELIGSLFKTHGDMTMGLAQYLIGNVLPSSFQNNQSENMYKFGIFLIDDMVEFLGYDRLKDKWFGFGDVLKRFTQDKSCTLRQAACYGLGIYAERTPTNATDNNLIESWMHSLIESAKIAKGSEKEKTYGNCRDNAIAAMGKIAKAHGSAYEVKPYLDVWLTMLPLRFDKPEAISQHQFLVDVMINKPDMLIGSTEQEMTAKLTRILFIYAEVNANSKITSKEIKIKMKQNLNTLHQSAGNILNKIWTELSEKQKKELNQIANFKE